MGPDVPGHKIVQRLPATRGCGDPSKLASRTEKKKQGQPESVMRITLVSGEGLSGSGLIRQYIHTNRKPCVHTVILA